MDNIPPETFDLIVQNLEGPLSSYATISRKWQQAVEARTMSNVHIKSDNERLFDVIFGSARRRALLKQLHYSIILPSYNEARWMKLPKRSEGPANNAAFTEQVRGLFERLRAYGDANESASIGLEINIGSPMDSYSPDPAATVNEGTGPARNNNTYISFDTPNPQPLPILKFITGFRLAGPRELHPTALGTVLNAIPSVEHISWQMYGPEVRLLSQRQEIRSSLAHVLSALEFSSLRYLDIYWHDASCGNNSWDAGSLLNPDTGIDELSVALRTISRLPPLRTLKLHGKFILGEEFFHIQPDSSTEKALWPSLEQLHLELSTITPAGGWYYTGDSSSIEPSTERSYDSEEEEEFIDSSDSETADYPAVWEWEKLNGERPYHPWRDRPDPTTFDPLLLGMTKAIPQMPALRRLDFKMDHSSGTVFEATYLAANEKNRNFNYLESDAQSFDTQHQGEARWEIIMTNDLSPDDEDGTKSTNWHISEDLKTAWRDSTGKQDNVFLLDGGHAGNRVIVSASSE
ncbi:hypothetical protein PVAG01_05625 [Phlyctema vagabunda]|uniref:F-box domain-containing protein n=1 Tax=Phlyctema vagabunda TaxID=108571 RepID=A0ABR4PKW1_9HELO